jgi:hypothetical protein
MSRSIEPGVLARAQREFARIAAAENLLEVPIAVAAKPLTPEEAIGTPERRDYPIIIGKERVIEAVVLGARGHAFTDSPRDWQGTLAEVLGWPLTSNQERAIFVATLNATLRHLDRVTGTLHCKDEDPELCAREIAELLQAEYGRARVGLIGLNPAIAERLVQVFDAARVRITDLCGESIGRQRFGVEIEDGGLGAGALIAASDVILVTGTTLVNGTFDAIDRAAREQHRPCWVYGVTAAGVAALCGLRRVCPYGRDA